MRIGALRHLFAWAPVHRFYHIKYGRAGDDLGIGSRPDYPDAYLAQLAEPFRKSPSEHSAPEVPQELMRS